MAEEVSHQQEKNISRKTFLLLLIPFILLLSFFTIQLVYQVYENTVYLDKVFSKEQYTSGIVTTAEETSWLHKYDGNEVLEFSGLFFQHTLASNSNNPNRITLKIFDAKTTEELFSVTLEPNESLKLDKLKKHHSYRVQIEAPPDNYQVTFY